MPVWATGAQVFAAPEIPEMEPGLMGMRRPPCSLPSTSTFLLSWPATFLLSWPAGVTRSQRSLPSRHTPGPALTFLSTYLGTEKG